MGALESHTSSQSNVGAELVAEANHRFANHLALLAGMVQMQANAAVRGTDALSRAEVRRMLQATAGRIVSVGNLHRRLSHSGHDADIELGDYLIENVTALISTFALAEHLSIAQRLDKNCVVAPDQAATIALIVNEVLMNAIKHAHPTGIPTLLSLNCCRNGDGSLSITIGDDGVGLPEEFDVSQKSGVGLKLIRTLADRLNAQLEIESDSLGLLFHLRVPPKNENVVPISRAHEFTISA